MDKSKNSSELPKAYIIAGHGDEITGETFIVPPGCTIVINMHSLQSMYFIQLIEKISNILKLNRDKLKQPVKYSTDIMDATQSTLAIYTEGTECPYIYYTLVSCILENGICFKSSSGIYDVDDLNVVQSLYKHISYFKLNEIVNASMISEYIFKNSIYPLSLLNNENTTIQDKMVKLIETKQLAFSKNDKDFTYKDLLEYLMKDPAFKITQEELCKQKPGVYYNFLCRYNKSLSPIVYNPYKNFNGIEKNVLKNDIHNKIYQHFTNRYQNYHDDIKKKYENMLMDKTIPRYNYTNNELQKKINYINKLKKRQNSVIVEYTKQKQFFEGILKDRTLSRPYISNGIVNRTNYTNEELQDKIKKINKAISTRRNEKKNIYNAITENIVHTIKHRTPYVAKKYKTENLEEQLKVLYENIVKSNNDIEIFTEELTKWTNIFKNETLQKQNSNTYNIPIEKVKKTAEDNIKICNEEIERSIKYIEDANKEIQLIEQQLVELYSSMKGGGPLPLRFFDVNAEHPSADAGNDLLNTSGRLVRPAIGGKRTKRTRRKSKCSKRSKRTMKRRTLKRRTLKRS